MKKAFLGRIIGILLLALAISSAISYYFIGEKMLKDNIVSMAHAIYVIDYAIDYEGNLQEEVTKLKDSALRDNARVTVITKEGIVLADSEVQNVREMENHLSREEIKLALADGEGYATRHSSTLDLNMLYVAIASPTSDYILRMAVPYTSIFDYMKNVLPILILGIVISCAISSAVAVRFANTVAKPLNEISSELSKVKTHDWNFTFKTYKYDELNVISESTTKLSEEIRNHIEKLEFEKKVRQEFFSNASHELKTPITSVKGYAELLDQGFVKDEETKKDFIQRILKETDNMTNLINDILMISRLETNEAQVSFSMVRMSALVEEIFESLETIAADYQIKLEKSCEPIVIEASEKQMRELLVNLMSNGIKYNRPGGKVFVRIGRESDEMFLIVSDNGMGVSKEDQERIFQRFYRVDKGRSKKMGGTGLGLSIVKHIVEFYDGKISLSSTLGEGSTFEVRIPLTGNSTLPALNHQEVQNS